MGAEEIVDFVDFAAGATMNDRAKLERAVREGFAIHAHSEPLVEAELDLDIERALVLLVGFDRELFLTRPTL